MTSSRLLAVAVGGPRVASVRYRVMAIVPSLEAAGFDVRLRFPVAGGRLARLADLLRDTARPAGEEVFFVHRKTYPPPFARRLRRKGRAFVFDMDDALDLPPPGRDFGEAVGLRYRRNFVATVAQADLVLCGNGELAARVPHGRTAIVPTAIDTDRFRPGAARPAEGPVLGWVGHSDNLPYLEALGEPLRELARRHPGLKLVVVADRPLEIPGVDVVFRKWRLEEEISCFDGIAVGLMPLEDTPWARAKCAFKAIQYMALGIPAVASPVGMNRELIRDGVNGFLPADPSGWVAAIDLLLRDAATTRAVGARGRDTVEREFSVDRVGRRVAGLCRRVAEARQSRSGA